MQPELSFALQGERSEAYGKNLGSLPRGSGAVFVFSQRGFAKAGRCGNFLFRDAAIGGYLPIEKCYSYEPFTDGMTDEEVRFVIDAINEFTSEVDMQDVRLYPEIGGKTANLGSIDEIIEICKNCKYCYPCIDIAHLHARENGSIVSKKILREKLEKVKNALPEKFKYVHFHAYTINYNEKGEITITKSWDDDNNRDGLRKSVDVKLIATANDEEVPYSEIADENSNLTSNLYIRSRRLHSNSYWII